MPEVDYDLANKMSSNFNQEVSRRDNKIRSLGVEIDNLTKERDKFLNDLRNMNLDLQKSKDELKSIDDVISSKKKEFEDSKVPVHAVLNQKENDLNSREMSLNEKEKASKEKDTVLDLKQEAMDKQRMELIDNLKQMSTSVTTYIQSVIEAMGGV